MTKISALEALRRITAARPIQEAGKDGGRHQALMNQAYDRWRAEEKRDQFRPDEFPKPDLSHEAFVNGLEDPERLAVVFGNLNYQIGNGGVSQWIFNGYKDSTLAYLDQYFEKYKAKYKGIAAVAEMVDRLDEALQDSVGVSLHEYDDQKHGPDSFRDRVSEAAGDEDWDKVDELLGGTDLLSYRDPVADTIKNNKSDWLTVSTKEHEPGVFYGYVEFDDRKVEKVGPFATEDEADAAAQDAADEWEALNEEELHNKAVEELQEEIDKLVLRHADDMGAGGAFKEADDAFDEVSDQMLQDVEDILNTEFALAGQADKFIDQQLADGADKHLAAAFKAKRAVADATARYRAQRSAA